MCPGGVFSINLHFLGVSRVTFFDFGTGYFRFHGLVLAKLSRAMSRLTLAPKNVTVYFFTIFFPLKIGSVGAFISFGQKYFPSKVLFKSWDEYLKMRSSMFFFR